jgi:hypothetical protein
MWYSLTTDHSKIFFLLSALNHVLSIHAVGGQGCAYDPMLFKNITQFQPGKFIYKLCKSRQLFILSRIINDCYAFQKKIYSAHCNGYGGISSITLI